MQQSSILLSHIWCHVYPPTNYGVIFIQGRRFKCVTGLPNQNVIYLSSNRKSKICFVDNSMLLDSIRAFLTRILVCPCCHSRAGLESKKFYHFCYGTTPHPPIFHDKVVSVDSPYPAVPSLNGPYQKHFFAVSTNFYSIWDP